MAAHEQKHTPSSRTKQEEQGRLGEDAIRRKQQNPNEAVGDTMEDRPDMPQTPPRSGVKQAK